MIAYGAFDVDGPSLSQLLGQVAHALGVSVTELEGPRRHRQLVRQRQVAMAAMRHFGHSFPEIGRVFRRDHTTVMHHVQHALADPDLSRLAKRLVDALLSPGTPQRSHCAVHRAVPLAMHNSRRLSAAPTSQHWERRS